MDSEAQQFLGDFLTDVFDDEDFFNFDFSETPFEHENSDLINNSCDKEIKKESVNLKRSDDDYGGCKTLRYPISSNDVKRTYAKQYEIAVNTHEYETYMEMMRSICTPDVLGVISHPRGCPQGLAYLELSGLDVLADYVFKSFTAAPDSMCFMHDSQVIGLEDGGSLVVCKFSVSGSRLFTVTSEMQGQKLPDPSSLHVLHNALGKKVSGGSDVVSGLSVSSKGKVRKKQQQQELQQQHVETEEGEGGARDAIKQSVVFKGASNKYDRYKKQKVSTLGAFVNYKEFSETSLRVKARPDKVGAEHTNNTLVEGFRNDEVMIAGSEVSFGFSELLPLPVKMHVVGVQKFHVNANNKVFKMEYIVAYR